MNGRVTVEAHHPELGRIVAEAAVRRLSSGKVLMGGTVLRSVQPMVAFENGKRVFTRRAFRAEDDLWIRERLADKVR